MTKIKCKKCGGPARMGRAKKGIDVKIKPKSHLYCLRCRWTSKLEE
jgi:hypothetical protein